jgi:dolichol-phosphate mannosyltransferase
MSTLVVIPTYNEARTIERLLDAVLLQAVGADILVVDDGSPDGTGALVLAHPAHGTRLHLLDRDRKEGLGAAYRAGFAWAHRRGYEQIVQMDADFSHPPERIPALLEALEHADVAIGSRYVDGGAVENWPWTRRLISKGGNTYVRMVLGLSVHDATAGFRAFRADALLRLGARESASNGYSFQIENAWRACRIGLRIEEVPITFTDRTEGSSKMTGSIVREALVRVLAWRWQELRHRGPLMVPTTPSAAGQVH